jgi:hypothetical protein
MKPTTVRRTAGPCQGVALLGVEELAGAEAPAPTGECVVSPEHSPEVFWIPIGAAAARVLDRLSQYAQSEGITSTGQRPISVTPRISKRRGLKGFGTAAPLGGRGVEGTTVPSPAGGVASGSIRSSGLGATPAPSSSRVWSATPHVSRGSGRFVSSRACLLSTPPLDSIVAEVCAFTPRTPAPGQPCVTRLPVPALGALEPLADRNFSLRS